MESAPDSEEISGLSFNPLVWRAHISIQANLIGAQTSRADGAPAALLHLSVNPTCQSKLVVRPAPPLEISEVRIVERRWDVAVGITADFAGTRVRELKVDRVPVHERD